MLQYRIIKEMQLILLSALVCALAGCYDPGYPAQHACTPTESKCPPGQVCNGTWCVPAQSSPDTRPDSPLAEQGSGRELPAGDLPSAEQPLDLAGSETSHDTKVQPDTGPQPDMEVTALGATLTDETWYGGGTSCSPSSMTCTVVSGKIMVVLYQIPYSSVPGTCTGHSASAAQIGNTIYITINKTGGSACYTACWDLDVEISGVNSGSFTVKYLNLSKTVSVP